MLMNSSPQLGRCAVFLLRISYANGGVRAPTPRGVVSEEETLVKDGFGSQPQSAV